VMGQQLVTESITDKLLIRMSRYDFCTYYSSPRVSKLSVCEGKEWKPLCVRCVGDGFAAVVEQVLMEPNEMPLETEQ